MFARIIMLSLISIASMGCSSINNKSSSVKDKGNPVMDKSSSIDSNNNVAAEITANFSRAVKEKNAGNFKSLFLNENVSWFAIVSEQDINRYKNNPNHKKVNLHEIGPFSEWLVKTQESTEVNFSDCKTSGDADVMVSDCEYAFYLGGRKNNYGREVFILINTESGWKISSIAFSATGAKE